MKDKDFGEEYTPMLCRTGDSTQPTATIIDLSEGYFSQLTFLVPGPETVESD